MAKDILYVDPEELKIVGLDTEDKEDHPLWDPRIYLPLDDNFVKNIMVYGVQHTVNVRQEASVYYVVDGRQRVRAAREAKKRQGEAGEVELKVPIRIVKADDRRVVGIMVSLNEQNHPDEILEKAHRAGRLLDMGRSMEEVCIDFGRSEPAIRGWLSLLEADPQIHEAVRTHKISASIGIELAGYPRAEQGEKLERYMRSIERGEKPSSTKVKKERKKEVEPSRPVKQTGVRRTWLRLALLTQAAKDLSDERRAILEWFATGKTDGDRWFDEFVKAVNDELEE